MQYSESGFSYVPEYQASGLPYVTQSVGSSKQITFPFVTQWITIKTSGSYANVAFTANGLALNNKFILSGTAQIGPLNLRIKELFITTGAGGSTEVIAGLTTISPFKAPTISGSVVNGNTVTLAYDGVG